MSRWDDSRDSSRDPARDSSPQGNSPRSGHRREFDPRTRRESFAERKDRALIDVAVYRTVSLRDLKNARFGGHPYTTSKAINAMVRAGWMQEHTAKGPKGRAFKVLTVTPAGAKRAGEITEKYGLSKQATWSGLVKRSELRHELAVYRAAQVEKAKLEAQGFAVERVRIDAEMKRDIARATATRGAVMERRRVARQLGLPIREGRVLVPDAQLQYRDQDGQLARVNIEVVSEHYSEASIAAKGNAGFAVHAAGGSKSGGRVAARIAAVLGSAGGGGSRSGGSRGGGRAGGSIDL